MFPTLSGSSAHADRPASRRAARSQAGVDNKLLQEHLSGGGWSGGNVPAGMPPVPSEAKKTCVKAMCESPNGHYQVAYDEHGEPYCKPVQ
jgi:hypothetical protein